MLSTSKCLGPNPAPNAIAGHYERDKSLQFSAVRDLGLLLNVKTHNALVRNYVESSRANTAAQPTRGQPTGKFIKVAGKHDAYLATPAPEKAHKDTAIVYVPDIFSIWQNSQLMADQFAANGYLTLIIDPFNGDKFPDPRPDDFNIFGWFQKGTNGDNPHLPGDVDPIVVAAIKTLKEEYGAKKIGGVGYCFGAKVSPVWSRRKPSKS